MARVSCFLGLLFLVVLVTGAFGQTAADVPNEAGLVIQADEERVETLCVSFEEAQIRGIDLLTLSGLELTLDTSGGMGLMVCEIEGLGCAYPAEHCFCQCMGGEPCAYWNYYYRDPGEGEWTYSALGALLRKVQPGSVEAWVWGDGKTPPSSDLTFEAICGLETVTPTVVPATPTVTATLPAVTASAAVETPATPVLTATVIASATATSTESPTPLPSATLTPTVPSSEPTPAPGSEPEPNLAAYWPFGAMILGLAVVGVLVWLRRV